MQTSAILAMARHQLKQSDLVRAALEKAEDVARKTLPKLDSAELGPHWIDLIICDALLCEAKVLIEGGTVTTGETK